MGERIIRRAIRNPVLRDGEEAGEFGWSLRMERCASVGCAFLEKQLDVRDDY